MALSVFIEDIFIRDIVLNTGIHYCLCISLNIRLPKTTCGGCEYLRDERLDSHEEWDGMKLAWTSLKFWQESDERQNIQKERPFGATNSLLCP